MCVRTSWASATSLIPVGGAGVVMSFNKSIEKSQLSTLFLPKPSKAETRSSCFC